jgi:hypothetical protein
MMLSRGDADLWASFEAVVLNRTLPFTFRPWEAAIASGGPPHLLPFLWGVAAGHMPLLELLSEPSRLSVFEECCTYESEDGKLPFLSAMKHGHQNSMELLMTATKFRDIQQKHMQLGIAMKVAIKPPNPGSEVLPLEVKLGTNPGWFGTL